MLQLHVEKYIYYIWYHGFQVSELSSLNSAFRSETLVCFVLEVLSDFCLCICRRTGKCAWVRGRVGRTLEFVVGAMVTHHLGSVVDAGVLHLLSKLLHSSIYQLWSLTVNTQRKRVAAGRKIKLLNNTCNILGAIWLILTTSAIHLLSFLTLLWITAPPGGCVGCLRPPVVNTHNNSWFSMIIYT